MGQIVTRTFAVIRRDLLKFKRNPMVIMMSLVMPIIYLVILGNSFQGKLKHLPVGVVNLDSGHDSRLFVNKLRAVENGPGTFTLVMLRDQEAAVRLVRDGRLKAAIIIPRGFTRRYLASRSAEAGLFIDNTDGISAATIRDTVRNIFDSISIEYVPIREPGGRRYLRDTDLYPKVDYDQSLVPGVVIMAIFLGTLTTGAFNLVMDRFLGIDESYLLTPLKKTDIVAGLVVSGVIITTIITALVMLISMLITGIPLSGSAGRYGLIFAVLILTTVGMLNMMFVFLGRISHPRIMGILTGFLNVIFFFPSGAVYPVESFPGWLRTFAKVNPEAYAVHALKSLLFKDVGLSAIYQDIVFLSGFALIMMITAVSFFKRTL
ncbi:MAG: ABC transporter permease [Deferribacteres bacterium]|nr:ABC transporter permease [Deferribacteres bacterium]